MQPYNMCPENYDESFVVAMNFKKKLKKKMLPQAQNKTHKRCHYVLGKN